MLTIKKPVQDIPCFMTGSRQDCYLVHFKDRSFSGVLSLSALLDILQRKSKEAKTEEKTAKKKNESQGDSST